VDQGPQDAQELVHEDTDSLHLGEGVVVAVLEAKVESGKGVIDLNEAQDGKEEGSAEARAALVGHGSLGAGLAARSVRDGLGTGQLDELPRVGEVVGVTDLGEDDGGGDKSEAVDGQEEGRLGQCEEGVSEGLLGLSQMLLEGDEGVDVESESKLRGSQLHLPL